MTCRTLVNPSVRHETVSDPRCATADYRPCDAYQAVLRCPLSLELALTVPLHSQSTHAIRVSTPTAA
jgi:hypothetical protein